MIASRIGLAAFTWLMRDFEALSATLSFLPDFLALFFSFLAFLVRDLGEEVFFWLVAMSSSFAYSVLAVSRAGSTIGAASTFLASDGADSGALSSLVASDFCSGAALTSFFSSLISDFGLKVGSSSETLLTVSVDVFD